MKYLLHITTEKVDTKIPEDPNEEFAPIINPWNLLISTFLNSQVVLNCNSHGNPKPVIKWLRATAYGDKILKENRRFSLYDNGSLVIKNVDYSDKGQYFCRATNKHGIIEKHLLLMVKCKL